MNEDVKMVLEIAGDHMEKSFKHFEIEVSKIRAGKAHPSMLQGIKVNYYGSDTPLEQMSTVSIADARTLTVQPWERKMLQEVEKALLAANLGITPMNDGQIIRLPIPPLTEDRRKELVKQTREQGEKAKIAIRNVRKETNKELDQLQKDGVSEDEVKRGKSQLDVITKEHEDKIDQDLKMKEDEIMTV
jgi:ribosome recycling factor